MTTTWNNVIHVLVHLFHCVKSEFQILYAVEQFILLFSKDKLKQGAHIHQPMIRLPPACRGRTAVWFPANSDDMCCVEVALKGFASTGKGLLYTGFPRSLTDGYAMPMSPSKGKTAVHGCHCLRDMAVSMREVMARSWVGVCVPQQEGISCAHTSPWASVCRFGAEVCFVYTFFATRVWISLREYGQFQLFFAWKVLWHPYLFAVVIVGLLWSLNAVY